MYMQISQEVLNSHTTPTQVRNYVLNQAWDKYKACKEWEEQMGGGDGDADREVGENDDDEALDEKKPRPKRKKGALPGNYSLKVLQAFKESEVYQLLDARYVVQFDHRSAWPNYFICRAQGDNTIIQTFDCNSAEDILALTDTEDDEQFKTPAKKRIRKQDSQASTGSSPDTNAALLQDAILMLKTKAQNADAIAQENLRLAKKRDAWEEEDCKERCEMARRQELREEKELRAKEWAQAMEMLNHANLRVQKAGKDLIEKLSTAEEQEKAT